MSRLVRLYEAGGRKTELLELKRDRNRMSALGCRRSALCEDPADTDDGFSDPMPSARRRRIRASQRSRTLRRLTAYHFPRVAADSVPPWPNPPGFLNNELSTTTSGRLNP